jgi:hypothetical protein
MDEDDIRTVNQSTDASGNLQEPEGNPPTVPVNLGKVDPPQNTSTSNEHINKRKRKALSCFEMWTIVLAGFGILVAGFTGAAIIWQDKIASATLCEIQKQYPELRKSADAATTAARAAESQVALMGKQLEAIQAAVIIEDGAWMNQTGQANIWNLGIKLRNLGHGPAHNTKAALYVERQTVPDGVLIGVRYPWNIDFGEFPAPTELSPSFRNPEYLIKIPDADLALIHDTKETIKVSGKIVFENGFSQRDEPVCFKYFSVTIGNSAPNGYPLPCDEFESQYRAVIEMKRLASGQTQKKHESTKQNPN